jgi:hypothetical protein
MVKSDAQKTERKKNLGDGRIRNLILLHPVVPGIHLKEVKN